MIRRQEIPNLAVSVLPLGIILLAFFLLPFARLLVASFGGPQGPAVYGAVLMDPRYLSSLVSTVVLALAVTLVTLLISGLAGVFLDRNRFPGRSIVVAMLTLPLAFPGVVVGFMVIMLAGRQGVIGEIAKLVAGRNLVFAYSITGLFIGYVYFSIPRVILTVMASAEKLDRSIEEAARSLGASSWRVVIDVIIPGLMPAFVSAGAICFATAMGAFGTAFTLATDINVLPMTIYTEFTLRANIATAAALSVVLGVITWIVLAIARTAAGNTVAAAG
ncbi:MAG: transporter permease subunit [Rhodospirillales bacterium]|jgi:putative spermidine/putrescine transport system permease protein|nr:transporter permease subunit [Rhodospirillales bacterium]